MDLQQEWNRLNESRFGPGEPLRLAVANLMQHPKKSPLFVLRRGAYLNLAFTAAFIILFGILFFRFPHPYIRICLGVLVLSYLAALLFTIYKLKKLPPLQDMSGALLPVMKAYHDQLRSWLDWQEKVALFIYPVSVLGGAFLGIASEGNLDELLQKPPVLWILGITTLVVTPAAHWLARWMGRVAFGKYLDQLKTNIEHLEKTA